MGPAGDTREPRPRLDLRPWIGRNRLCHSLGLTSPSLPRHAAAIGRAAPTSASPRAGVLKGRLTRARGGSRPQGLPKPPWLGPLPRNLGSHTALAALEGAPGGSAGGGRAGALAPPGLCCAVCARVHVPACAWAPAAAWARPWGAGVCTQMHGVRRAPCRPVSLAAGRGPGRAGLTCAHAHWRLQGRPPSLLGEAHSGRAPQQVHRAPALAPPLLLLSLRGWCSKRGHPFRGTLFQ